MRVLILSHMYPSPANMVKGIFVHQQNLELRRQGCPTVVLAPKPWSPFPLSVLHGRWRAYAGIPTRRELDGVNIFSPAYLVLPAGMGMARSGVSMYAAVRKSVQLLHGQSPFNLIYAHTAIPDGQAGLHLKKLLGIPLVVTVHGKDVQQTATRNRRCRQAIAQVVAGADRVIAVSTKIKGMLDTISGLPEKTVVIHNGFVAEGYTRCGESVPGRIVSVSNLVESKGIDLNIRAVARLKDKFPDISYTIVGSGPAELGLRSLAQTLGVAERVKFYGRVENRQVPGLLTGAQIFSLPSFMEGFGIAYLEAMAAGLPVVACQGEGIEDVIGSAETGLLVEAGNLDQLTAALAQLLSNPAQAARMGERGRELALSDFTWRENGLKTISLFEEVISHWGING